MYKPFTKAQAIALALKLQRHKGKSFPDTGLVFKIDNITPIPYGDAELAQLREIYFKSANKFAIYNDVVKKISDYKGTDFDVVAFAKAPTGEKGYSSGVIPVSSIAVTPAGFEYGFPFLDDIPDI